MDTNSPSFNIMLGNSGVVCGRRTVFDRFVVHLLPGQRQNDGGIVRWRRRWVALTQHGSPQVTQRVGSAQGRIRADFEVIERSSQRSLTGDCSGKRRGSRLRATKNSSSFACFCVSRASMISRTTDKETLPARRKAAEWASAKLSRKRPVQEGRFPATKAGGRGPGQPGRRAA